MEVPGSDGKESRRTHPFARTDPARDAELLDRWRRQRCTDAFRELVSRHTGWVCALARRRVKDRHLAEDVTQAVFLILSRKAGRIGPDTPLSAWLFRVTRFASNDAIKCESRRRKRIERAATFASETTEPAETRPDIDVDECISCLGDADRQVILLRFYEEKSMQEVAQALGITEHAAKKRVSRALNRLRRVFARRGVRVGSLLSLAMMVKQTAAPEAASGGVFSKVMAQAGLSGGAPSAPIAELANATLRSLATAHARILAALAGASVVLCLAVSTLSPVMGQALAPFFQKVRTFFVAPAQRIEPLGTTARSAEAENKQGDQPVRQVWAGRAGGFAWPLLPGSTGSLSLQSLALPPISVAIIEDQQGNRWYRKVDPELIPPSPDPADPRSYHDLNPYVNSSYQQALLNQVAQDLTFFDDPPASADAWQPLDRLRLDDGSIYAEDLQINYAETSPPIDGFTPINVPEPAGLSVCVAALLSLRRRRRL